MRIAGPDEQVALANMMQLYIHDFSERWAGTDEGDLGDDGRFAPYPLDRYWREPDRTPLLVRWQGRLAGFALLNVISNSGAPVDHNMAEFFIVRKYRRSGIGTAAAHAIFSRYPGIWEAAVARTNSSALAFWRGAISQHPAAVGVAEREVANDRWNGPVLNFRVLKAAAG